MQDGLQADNMNRSHYLVTVEVRIGLRHPKAYDDGPFANQDRGI